MTNLSRNSLLLLVAAAVALGALIFGLGGGVSIGNLLLWAVMMVAIASAVMLYAKPKAEPSKTNMSEKK
jgi:high-affinity Fe2+/Pb2+ permease